MKKRLCCSVEPVVGTLGVRRADRIHNSSEK